MSELTEFAPWAAMALNSALSLYAIFNGRAKEAAKKNDQRFAAIEDQFNARDAKIGVIVAEASLLSGRVGVVEHDIQHLPDKDVTHRLELGLAAMQAEMRGLSEKIRPIGAMADRIQEAMIDKVMS